MSLVDIETNRNIPLKNLAFHLQVLGHLSEVELTLQFENESKEQIREAELEVPLEPGALVTGFSSDIKGDGVLIDAVLVSKETARKTFEDETTKFNSQSAAIVEQHGNVFKTKLNLINPKSLRTIKIKIYQPLQLEKRTTQAFSFPLDLKAPILFELRCTVLSESEPKLIIEDLNYPYPFEIKETNRWTLSLTNPQQTIKTKAIKLKLNNFTPFPLFSSLNSEFFFTFRNQVPKIPQKTVPTSKKTNAILIAWDTSFSRNPIRSEAQKKSIETDISAVKKIIQKSPNSIIICSFNISHTFQKFSSLEFSNIEDYLRSLEYIGTTTLQWMNQLPIVDFCILFSDGFFFENNFDGFKKITKIHVLCSAEKRSEKLLKLIAKKWNGQFFLTVNESDLSHAISVVFANDVRFGFLYAEIDDRFVYDLLPSSSVQVIQGLEEIEFSGKLRESVGKTEIKIHYGDQSIQETSVVKLEWNITKNSFSYEKIIPQTWANQKIEEINLQFEDEESREQQLQEIGKKFGVVTDATSFIILHELEQFLKHKICPPESLPEILQEYRVIIQSSQNRERSFVQRKMEHLMVCIEKIQRRETDSLFLNFKVGIDDFDAQYNFTEFRRQVSSSQVNDVVSVKRSREWDVETHLIMKYGKSQKARIQSLLRKKSAKQCKAKYIEEKEQNWKEEMDEDLPSTEEAQLLFQKPKEPSLEEKIRVIQKRRETTFFSSKLGSGAVRPTEKSQFQFDWELSPSISDWKNQEGSTIPLDKRLDEEDRPRRRDVQTNPSEGFFFNSRQEIGTRQSTLRAKSTSPTDLPDLRKLTRSDVPQQRLLAYQKKNGINICSLTQSEKRDIIFGRDTAPPVEQRQQISELEKQGPLIAITTTASNVHGDALVLATTSPYEQKQFSSYSEWTTRAISATSLRTRANNFHVPMDGVKEDGFTYVFPKNILKKFVCIGDLRTQIFGYLYGASSHEQPNIKEIRCIVLVPQIGSSVSVQVPTQLPYHDDLKQLEPLGWIHTQPDSVSSVPNQIILHSKLIAEHDCWDTKKSVIISCTFTPGSCSLVVNRLSPIGFDWGTKNQNVNEHLGFSSFWLEKLPLFITEKLKGFFLVPGDEKWNLNFERVRFSPGIGFDVTPEIPKEFYHEIHRPFHFQHFSQLKLEETDFKVDLAQYTVKPREPFSSTLNLVIQSERKETLEEIPMTCDDNLGISFFSVQSQFKIPSDILAIIKSDKRNAFLNITRKNLGWDSYLALSIFNLKKNTKDDFLKSISSITELALDNIQLLRVFVYMIDQTNLEVALPFSVLKFYEIIHERRKEDPLALRDYLLCLMEHDKEFLKVNEICKLLKKLLESDFGTGFSEIVWVHEAIRWIKSIPDPLEAKMILGKGNGCLGALLEKYEEQDLRVTIQWDNPDADCELHVYEPGDQHCYWMNNVTKNGGILSCESGGVGPQEYTLRNAVTGEYKVSLKLFWIRRVQPVVVFVRVWSKGQLVEHSRTCIILQEAKTEVPVFFYQSK